MFLVVPTAFEISQNSKNKVLIVLEYSVTSDEKHKLSNCQDTSSQV